MPQKTKKKSDTPVDLPFFAIQPDLFADRSLLLKDGVVLADCANNEDAEYILTALRFYENNKPVVRG